MTSRCKKQHYFYFDKNTIYLRLPSLTILCAISGCDQLVVGQTHARGETLDLMTDATNLVRVAAFCIVPISNSDHSSLSAVIPMAQAVPNLYVIREVLMKHLVNWSTICGAIQDQPWHNIWLADNPVEVLNEHLSLLVRWTLCTNQGHPCAQQGLALI